MNADQRSDSRTVAKYNGVKQNLTIFIFIAKSNNEPPELSNRNDLHGTTTASCCVAFNPATDRTLRSQTQQRSLTKNQT
jgi:hypothetical protein